MGGNRPEQPDQRVVRTVSMVVVVDVYSVLGEHTCQIRQNRQKGARDAEGEGFVGFGTIIRSSARSAWPGWSSGSATGVMTQVGSIGGQHRHGWFLLRLTPDHDIRPTSAHRIQHLASIHTLVRYHQKTRAVGFRFALKFATALPKTGDGHRCI